MKGLLLLMLLCASVLKVAIAEVQPDTESAYTESRPVMEHSGEAIAVTDFDVDRLMGKWYEISRLPSYFAKHCQAPIIIEYTHEGNTIHMQNSCATVSGEKITNEGIVYLNDNNLNGDGKLVGTSMPIWLRWLHLGRNDYWVLFSSNLYLMVGTPDHKYLWIFSRDESPSLKDIQSLITQAKQQGFAIENLIFNYPSYYAE